MQVISTGQIIKAYCNCIQPNIGKQRLNFKYDFLICVYKRKLE